MKASPKAYLHLTSLSYSYKYHHCKVSFLFFHGTSKVYMFPLPPMPAAVLQVSNENKVRDSLSLELYTLNG